VLNDGLASVVPRIKAVRELGAGLHASSHIWSQSGQPAVTLWPRCWRALGLRLGEAVRGKTTMAKVLMKRSRLRARSSHALAERSALSLRVGGS
jgi:hypothetical protein